jgi:undecaprenyl-diphosphatase
MLTRLVHLHRENRVLLSFLVALLLAVGFGALADEMGEGEVDGFDRAVTLALRTPADPAIPIGPVWLKEAAIDLTALGGVTILTLVTVLAIAFLVLRRRSHQALLVFVAVTSGSIFAGWLKAIYDRPRPAIVPHLVEVNSLSFPSGHAMNSAIVYLTLATILARSFREPSTRGFIIAVALALVIAIGCTRVFLGVHYPSDVIAGWSVGAAWALLVGVISSRLQDAHKIEQPAETLH